MKSVFVFGFAVGIFVLVGCTANTQQIPREQVPVAKVDPNAPIPAPMYVGRETVPPPGTARHCWVEPKVDYEQMGPGLNVEGHWYHPSYAAVREVKMGRWVPCETYR